MSINIETRLGIPPHPPFVRHQFQPEDPLVMDTAKVMCDVFNLDQDVFLDEMLCYVVESLNQKRGLNNMKVNAMDCIRYNVRFV